MKNLEELKKKLEFITSQESEIVPGNYQKDKQRIEKKNKQRYWNHVVDLGEGVSVWRNKDHYLIYENGKEGIYKGNELPQLSFNI
jgi:hypothetical protein